MENKVLKLGVGRSTQVVHAEIRRGVSERWTIQSQKRKYVDGEMSGVIDVGYTASIDNSDYLLEKDKSNNQIQITARNVGSGLCVLIQDESGNRISIHLTTPGEEWEIRFTPKPFLGASADMYFMVSTNIIGEDGSMGDNGVLYKNWIVNQRRNMINVYISPLHPSGNNVDDLLSWSCFDKDGNAFDPNYSLPDNPCFTTKTTGLGSYTLTKISTPAVSSDIPILRSRFNHTKKYPLDLNFYWGLPT